MDNPFHSGDKVRIVNNWLPQNLKKQRVTILTFQTNNGKIFAKVLWKDNADSNKYGCLFPLDELRKV